MKRPMETSSLLAESFRAIDDARRDEDDEFSARVAGTTSLEENAEEGQVAKDGDLIEVAAGVAREDAADDCCMAVHDEQIGFRFALQNRGIATR